MKTHLTILMMLMFVVGALLVYVGFSDCPPWVRYLCIGYSVLSISAGALNSILKSEAPN